jgi:GGDEF domain-containing protein
MGAMDYLTKAKVDEFELAKCISYALYRKHWEVELQTMALRDTIAGLGNRVLFEENLRMSDELAKRPNENLGVLYIDLDGFVDQTRESDVVARIGGDEFAAVLVRVDKPESENKIAQSVENAISSTPHIIDGEEISISASVGASIFPSATLNIEDLVKVANIRMYGSKKAKKERLAQPESNVRIYQTAEIRDLNS